MIALADMCGAAALLALGIFAWADAIRRIVNK